MPSERIVTTRVTTPDALQRAADEPAVEVFDKLSVYHHEQVSYWFDPECGYRGIIAIHNTALGPALGGTRFWHYDTDDDALRDVLRLARGMTYKAAMAGLDLGGGKSVVIGDHCTTEREAIFRAHGRHVESLAGRYITAEDVGTSPSDMEWVRKETSHVFGLVGGFGDPSPVTAFGTFRGMQACAKVRYGSDSLTGKTVAVQGVGHVGYHLCKHLHEEGAKLIVTDIDDDKVKRVVDEFGTASVAPDEIHGVAADVFAPCALGAVINDDTLKVLKVSIVAGAANNQLHRERHGDALDEMGITYAPDYVINSGGLINVNAELEGWNLEWAHEKAGEIYDTILRVLAIAGEQKIPSYRAADHLAEQRVSQAERSRGLPHRI